jgi:lysozyme family protein
VGAAVKTLQRALGVSADGVVGSATLAAAWRFDSHAIVPKMLAARLDACRTFKTADAHFYGWAVRCFRLVEQAHAI